MKNCSPILSTRSLLPTLLVLLSFSFLPVSSLNPIPNFDFSSESLSPKKSGFTMSGFAAGDHFGYSVTTAGDINNDGYDDFLVGAYKWSNSRGIVYVIYGGPTNAFVDIDLSITSLNPATTGFAIMGQTAGDQFGYSVSSAGDINKDGRDDIVIGANAENAAYVIYGKTLYTSNIDLSSETLIPSSTGFKVTGEVAGDQFGYSVSSAGDFNKDTYDDIVIGACMKDSGKGAVYMIYGKASYSSDFNLGTTALNPSTTGFRITGATPGEHFGNTVSAAGDVNNDSWDDIVIGAEARNNWQGAVYAVWGSTNPADLDLSTLPLYPKSTGFTIMGKAVNDRFGSSLSKAGDVNKDGKDDILIGAMAADGGKGAAYVVYGKLEPPMTLDLSSAALNPATTGFTISGGPSNDHVGSAVAPAGDINNDGYDDILVGSEWWNSYRGAAYVIYGKSSPQNVDFNSGAVLDPTTTGFTMKGEAGNDNFGYGVGFAGDINSDGFPDLLGGAYKKDSGKGAVYVIYTGCMITNCISCASKVCKTCDPTVPAYLDSSSLCVTSCAIKKYGSSATGKCESCPSKCDTCTSGTVCTVCSSTYFLNQALSSCTQNCPTKTYALTSTKKCEACPSNCDTCTSGTVCTVCSATYFLDQALSSCTQNCPVKFYGRTSTKKCEACPANCDTCTSGTVCTVCSATYFLNQALSTCTQNCPIKFYGSTSTKKCEACLANCDTCTSGTVCTVCSASYSLNQARSACTQNCPITTYSSTSTQKCEACPSHCDICTDSNTCTTCTSSYFLYQPLSSCVQTCPTRLFGSTKTGKCEDCSADCLACTSETSCRSCDPKFAVVNGQCEACPVNCDACTSSMTCSLCTAPYLLSLSWCLPSCPNATYPSNGVCESCPAHCAVCTSKNACQTCDPDYVPANASSCVIPPTPYPKAEAVASKAIQSGVMAAGSFVCVGSVTFPQTTIVSKIVQNMRYINLTVTDELAQVYATWSTNLVPWDFPYFLGSVDDFREAPIVFSRYDLDSPFLTNFWSTLTTFSLSAGLFLGCVLLKILAERGGLKNSCIYSLLQRLVLGSFNFALVQIYGCLDSIVFYLVLDIRGNPLDSAYDWASIICASGFMVVGSLLIYSNFQMVRNYQRVKIEGQAKKAPNAIEDFNEKNKYWELFYGDFHDTDIWSQLTLAFIVVRSGFSSFIIAVLYTYPLMQTLLLIILDGFIILFLIKKDPFITLRGKLTQYYFEAITFLVHLVGFILSFQGIEEKFSEALLMALCSSIIYLNMGLTMGSVGFMFIELYKVISEKVRDKRKLEKTSETIAIQANLDNPDDDNDIQIFHITSDTGRGSPEKSRTVWMKKQQVFPLENSHFLPGVTEESNMTFTGINLLPSDTIAEDSILPDADRSYEQRGQSVMNVRDRRRNIKKKQPKDPLKY